MKMKVEVKGLKELAERAQAERAIRRPMRRGLREAAKAAKASMAGVARPISRRLARRIRVAVDRRPVPLWAKATYTYAGAQAIERGRRAGAKLPPVGALKGGFAARKAVAARGVPARPYFERAKRAAEPAVQAIMGRVAKEIEATWGR